MTQKRFYLNRTDYLGKLAKVMPKVSENGNMFPSKTRNEEAYFIDETEAILFYDGKNTIIIGARNQEKIRNTKSNLEKIAGIKLIQI